MRNLAPDDSLLLTRAGLVERATTASWEDPAALAALHQLARSYWYPLYAFARRAGWHGADAGGAVQLLLARLLRKDFLAGAGPGGGLLRPFLLPLLKRCLAGTPALGVEENVPLLPLDFTWAEARYSREPASLDIPEALYERCWALTILGYATARLEKEWSAKESEELFLALRPFLGYQAGGDEEQAAAAARLGLSLEDLKVKIHDLRTDYRAALLTQIAFTCDDQNSEVLKAEVTELLTAV